MGEFPLSTEGPPVLSDSRRVLAYSFDNILVCRRIDDLALLWAKALDVELETYRLAVSADGQRVAASLADRANGRIPGQYYIGIYEGKTGVEITRLPLVARTPVDGSAEVALSPDGKLVRPTSHPELVGTSVMNAVAGNGVDQMKKGSR